MDTREFKMSGTLLFRRSPSSDSRAIGIKRLTLRKHKIYSTLDINNDLGGSGRASRLSTFQYIFHREKEPVLSLPRKDVLLAPFSMFESPVSFVGSFFLSLRRVASH